jgi:hypothetical protein
LDQEPCTSSRDSRDNPGTDHDLLFDLIDPTDPKGGQPRSIQKGKEAYSYQVLYILVGLSRPCRKAGYHP